MKKKGTFLGLTFIGWYTVVSVLLVILAAVMCCFCTENTRARVWGGKETITLSKGQKLVEVTWKENNLWYLVEPMDSGYTPKTKVFQEASRLGVLEGELTFIENR